MKNEKPQVNSTSKAQPFAPDFLTPPTGEAKIVHFGEEGKRSLRLGRCPYCDTDEVEGMLFGGTDEREGGLLDCPYCKISIAWIDSPFEATELRQEV